MITEQELAHLAAELGVANVPAFEAFVEQTLSNTDEAYEDLRAERDAALADAEELKRALVSINMIILARWGSSSIALWHQVGLTICTIIERTLKARPARR